ncbi:hypothetical protein [Bradyrhizobium macuxiense]|uniref:hypothetical protein n=1 Tax=Bradyrhizobium macuxiense TaxID=1755647 RepID=UPI0010A956DA|nr:hypothetical protein [Bradyrhizobium macuxiense]
MKREPEVALALRMTNCRCYALPIIVGGRRRDAAFKHCAHVDAVGAGVDTVEYDFRACQCGLKVETGH